MIRTGLIGCGFMGRMHATCYKALPELATMVGVADVRDKEAGLAKDICGGRIYPSAEALIHDPAIQAVDICLPTFLHAKYAVMAARAGKHVLCEKPFALSLADADAVTQAAHKARITFMLAMVIRFWPEYVYLKELVASKKHGRLTALTCTRVGGFPGAGWENWFADPRRSGGCILDMHIHDTDFITHLLGQPRSVYTRGTKTKRGWDHIYTTYEYPQCPVCAEGGWDLDPGAGFRHAFRAQFADGTTVEHDMKNQPLLVHSGGASQVITLAQEGAGTANAGGNISSLGGYYREIKYWLECITGGTRPSTVTPAGARLSLGVLLKEMESAQTGKKIKV
jgi:predicted dehydrogenase